MCWMSSLSLSLSLFLSPSLSLTHTNRIVCWMSKGCRMCVWRRRRVYQTTTSLWEREHARERERDVSMYLALSHARARALSLSHFLSLSLLGEECVSNSDKLLSESKKKQTTEKKKTRQKRHDSKKTCRVSNSNEPSSGPNINDGLSIHGSTAPIKEDFF